MYILVKSKNRQIFWNLVHSDCYSYIVSCYSFTQLIPIKPYCTMVHYGVYVHVTSVSNVGSLASVVSVMSVVSIWHLWHREHLWYLSYLWSCYRIPQPCSMSKLVYIAFKLISPKILVMYYAGLKYFKWCVFIKIWFQLVAFQLGWWRRRRMFFVNKCAENKKSQINPA